MTRSICDHGARAPAVTPAVSPYEEEAGEGPPTEHV
jgi:hypothetical protein